MWQTQDEKGVFATKQIRKYTSLHLSKPLRYFTIDGKRWTKLPSVTLSLEAGEFESKPILKYNKDSREIIFTFSGQEKDILLKPGRHKIFSVKISVP